MELKTNTGIKIRRPNRTQIDSAVQDVDNGIESFVILEGANGGFVQIARETTGGFVLESRQNKKSPLKRASGESLQVPEIVKRLSAFAEGRKDWNMDLEFEVIEISRRKQTSILYRHSLTISTVIVVLGMLYLEFLSSATSSKPYFALLAFGVISWILEGYRTGELPIGPTTIRDSDSPVLFGCFITFLGLFALMLILFLIFV